jgi:hypothetical protein
MQKYLFKTWRVGPVIVIGDYTAIWRAVELRLDIPQKQEILFFAAVSISAPFPAQPLI